MMRINKLAKLFSLNCTSLSGRRDGGINEGRVLLSLYLRLACVHQFSSTRTRTGRRTEGKGGREGEEGGERVSKWAKASNSVVFGGKEEEESDGD